jgi:hypothetical protein
MGCQIGDIEEEGRSGLRRSADLRHRDVGEHVGLVERPLLGVRLLLAVLEERVAVVLVRRRIDCAEPVLPAGRRDDRRPRAVPVQVLADVDSVVARACECCDECRVLVLERLVAAERWAVAVDAVVLRVLAGEVRRARRAAQRERHDVLCERRALLRDEVVHMGHHAQRLDRLVVRHHRDDVRLARRDCRVVVPAAPTATRGEDAQGRGRRDRGRTSAGGRAGQHPAKGTQAAESRTVADAPETTPGAVDPRCYRRRPWLSTSRMTIRTVRSNC